MFDFLNKKIPMAAAFLVIFLTSALIAWAIFKSYEKIIKIQYERVGAQFLK